MAIVFPVCEAGCLAPAHLSFAHSVCRIFQKNEHHGPAKPACDYDACLLHCAEDVALIESLEESKRVATDISDKVAEARETEVAINDSRNK